MFEISALTREGCELLVQKIFQHIAATRDAEKPAVYVDPRFDEQRDTVDAPPDNDDPRFRA